MSKKIKKFFKTAFQLITNPRLLICLFIAWMITNGWSYLMFAFGTLYQIEWMIAISGAYLAFLWLPISPEKIITVFIAMLLLQHFFPNDEKTLGVLKELKNKYKKK